MAALAELHGDRLVRVGGARALFHVAELEVVEHQPALTAQDLHPIVRQPRARHQLLADRGAFSRLAVVGQRRTGEIQRRAQHVVVSAHLPRHGSMPK